MCWTDRCVVAIELVEPPGSRFSRVKSSVRQLGDDDRFRPALLPCAFYWAFVAVWQCFSLLRGANTILASVELADLLQ